MIALNHACRWDRIVAPAVLAVSLALGAGPAAAKDGVFRANYTVALSGLGIATASLEIQLDNANYAAHVAYQPAGLAKLVSSAHGDVTATGSLKGPRAVPSTYAIRTTDEKREQKATLAMAAGVVKSVETDPEVKAAPDRVPVLPEQLRNTLDPLSALMLPMTPAPVAVAAAAGTAATPAAPAVGTAAAGATACNRTLPVFDGWSRYDVQLSYKETRAANSKAFKGPVYVCLARWVPVSGHKPARESTKFMAENKDIEVWLAPIDSLALLVPYHLSIKTMSGMIVIDSDRFQVSEAAVTAKAAVVTP